MSVSTPSGSSLKPLNPGTTTLIRHRCEGDVRSRILRWSGLPIGGTSAVAFFVTLLVWIPQQVREADLAKFGQDLLRTYVHDAVTGNTEFRRKLDSIVRSTVTERAEQGVTLQIKKLSKESVGQTLASRVKNAVSRDVRRILEVPAMEAQVNNAVTAALQSNEYGLLRAAITPRLESMARRVSETIAKNAEQIIQKVSNPLPEDQIIDKGSYRRLQQILDDLRSGPLPDGDFALRFYIAAETGEDHSYVPGMIKSYLTELENVLRTRLRYVLILDRRGRFIALSELERFKKVIRQDASALETVLNRKSLSLEEAKRRIQNLLGPVSLAYVDGNLTIQEALQGKAMQSRNGPTSGLDRQVAVVKNGDATRTFQGVTSRRRLLEALLP